MSASSPVVTKRRILVVDDEELTRLFAAQSLEAAGYQVEEAEDGEAALTLVLRVNPELIVLDVLMPDKDGYEICRELRQSPNFRNTPILVMTGLDDPESVKKAYDAGATDFVTKPISWALLCHRVQYLLRGSDALAQLARSQVLLANAQRLAGLNTFDWQHSTDRLRVHGDIFDLHRTSIVDDEMTLLSFWEIFHAADRQHVRAEMTAGVRSQISCQLDCRIRGPYDNVQHVHLQCETVVGMDGAPLWTHGTLQDITMRKRDEEETRRLAYVDGLTGLPNRAAFKEELKSVLNRARRDGTSFSVLFLDVDNFKRINDSLGHDAGDQLLRRVASKLESCVRQDDFVSRPKEPRASGVVARLGGDEFTIILEGMYDGGQVMKIAERILGAFSFPIRIDEREIFVTSSIGIASYPDDGLDAETLLKNADTAMYAAKGLGRNRSQSYNPSMNDKSLAKLELDSAMRKGLENDQFFVQYQPRIDTRTDTLIGCEALVRWRHPQHGTISPGEFIGIAEETGFIVALDEWVLKQVCRQARRWRDMGLPAFYVSVNVSGLQFRHPGLVDSISEALATCALDPSALHVEITEGLLMRDTEQTLGIVKQINDMGIRVEIDDFGVGFSSLSYLNRFPVDALKIDLSFVRSVPLNRDNTAITKAIVSMAHSLELGVVAEGVETVRERDYLKSIGCFEMQGFLFSRAVDPDELEKVVRRPVQRRNESVMGG